MNVCSPLHPTDGCIELGNCDFSLNYFTVSILPALLLDFLLFFLLSYSVGVCLPTWDAENGTCLQVVYVVVEK